MTRDIQRYLLIAAIAVLSFMLLTEWVHFRQKIATTELVESTANPEAMPAPATPTAANTSVPTLPNATPAGNTTSQFVRVRTDVLDLQIDLNGGDIVHAALPKHSTSLETPDRPFVLLQQDRIRTFVAQSGLVGRDGTDTADGRPLYTVAANSYALADGQNELAVELLYETAEHVQIHKRFLFTRGVYVVGLNYRIDNLSEKPWQGALFGQLKRDGSVDPLVVSGALGMHSYLGAAAPTAKTTYEKLPFDDMKEQPLNETLTGGWIGIIQHYFLSAWIPDQKTLNQLSTLVTGDNQHIVRFTAPTLEIAPRNSGEFNAQLYAGPKDQYVLREIAPGLELSVDYGVLWMIAQPIFWLLTKIHGVVGNWGWAIVFVTLIVKILFFGLNAKAYKSMANMRKVQPKLLEIRERYADDRQKQSQEMMSLYKTEKINPLGGCLPILVQMPVFLALYWVLQESVELRHAPWLLWIKDLSAMDPYLILPLLMGASMFIQQKLNPAPPDPMQAKVMQWMPVMFTFFFLWFPAGLVLYWVVNNTLSIVQQYIITKRIENA
ncbi:MAG: membrane protein insertase YidC [Spongiibacteraceae bacterium]